MNIQDFHQLQEAYVNIYEKRRSEESGEDHPEVNEKNIRRQKLERKKKDKERYHQESVDYYDLVLSHLLDEGYADSEANAEVIMVNMSEEWLDEIIEATAMAKRGHNEVEIRKKIAASTRGGEAADRATEFSNRPTFGYGNSSLRQRYAAKQRGDFRKTASSSPGLHGYAYKSDNPDVKAKQDARGAQRGVLTPNEKKKLGR